MKTFVRRLLVKIISNKLKANLLHILYTYRRLIKKRGCVITNNEHEFIQKRGKHLFFGYYDISPFNKFNELLYIETDGISHKAKIHLRKSENNDVIVADTNVWNWQQGCRLRWLPDSDNTIVYNNYENGQYFCTIKNISSGSEKRIDCPLYDIDKTGRWGVSLNFARLGVLRPGYGYVNEKYMDDESLKDEGIDIVDILSNKKRRIITYKDITDKLNINSSDFKTNYINHLSFSPSGDKFLFFWISIIDGYHLAYLIVYDIKLNKMIPLETKDKVSHYLWLDDENIICTVYSEKNTCYYAKYNINGDKEIIFPQINFDGHPIKIDNETILTDSYPINNGYQKLLLCNLETQTCHDFFEIYSKPAATIEKRTDLHPRYNPLTKQVCIDVNRNGFRELCLIKVSNENIK